MATECRREVVVVRGRIQTAAVQPSRSSTDCLQLDNARLAALITGNDGGERDNYPVIDLTEHYEKCLYAAVGQSRMRRTVRSIDDVITPSESCSRYFVDHANLWTSWVHFAFFFPDFRAEHEQFWARDAGALSSRDSLWLAVYFSVLSSTLLFMDDDELKEIGHLLGSDTPLDSHSHLLRNWYDAALYFLEEGDFMQRSDIAVVRAIAILGIVATNVGDTHRHANLWACGIRTAQELDLGSDSAMAAVGETTLERETRRRLWWTLVICEWLPIPTRAPFVNDVDFDCQLPKDVDDAQLEEHRGDRFEPVTARQDPRPVQYHIVMSKIAIISYQLHSRIRLRRWSPKDIDGFVLQADNQLAALIEQLPPHLRNDELSSPETRTRDAKYPWIPYQKTSLAMSILYYRLAINRILQVYWLEGSTTFARARAVCLSSAMGVVSSAVSGSSSPTRLRSWAFAMTIFSAAVTLSREILGSTSPNPQFIQAVIESKAFLRRVQFQNKLASEALLILEELGDGLDHWS
ncbi:hypothetical protein N0V90_006038 [Kalmusia sp. IMI 367209]|nr:hypothetical protein N0V90_006038 [Kalmusia sp. IMI 367209]